MMTEILAAYSVAAQEQEPSTWIKLWQKPWSREAMQAGVLDLAQMWAMVLAGFSARQYRANACPAWIDETGAVIIPLDFYLFPSSLSLPYSVASAMGSLGEATACQVPKEFDLIFDQRDEVDLGYLAEGYSWEELCPPYNEFGQPIGRPAVVFEDGKAKLSTPCFWILRVRCMAQGYLYTLTMSLQKFEQEEEDGELNWTGYSITNLQPTVQATWMDGDGLQSVELELEIPPCVEDYLALCENGDLPGGIILNPDEPYFIVYWSTCTGNILDVRRIVPWLR